MFCPYCGTKTTTNDAHFCYECGSDIKDPNLGRAHDTTEDTPRERQGQQRAAASSMGAMMQRGIPGNLMGRTVLSVVGLLTVLLLAIPLLAGVAEASVARRLTDRSAFVRRLASVEALGRVDVVCCDKTGTLTQGRLALTLVDDLESSAELDGVKTPGRTREVLLCAALACPPPDSPEAAAHPTDGAVLTAASRLGLDEQLSEPRIKEAPFDPVRGLHVSGFAHQVCVKGAVEVLVPRCSHAVGSDGSARELDEPARAALMARATDLASRGLRVLMVADGPAQTTVEDPQGLTARGFVGISDAAFIRAEGVGLGPEQRKRALETALTDVSALKAA